MIKTFMEWSDKSLFNSFVGWLVLLFGLYIIAAPIYYIISAAIIFLFIGGGMFVLGLDAFKNKPFRNSVIGLVVALLVSFYISTNYLGSLSLWKYVVGIWN